MKKKDFDIRQGEFDHVGRAKVDQEPSRLAHSGKPEPRSGETAEGLDGTEEHELRRAEREAKRRSKALGEPGAGRSRGHRDSGRTFE